MELVIILFGISLPIMIKGVITIRKERKVSRSVESKNKKSKK
jgi:hypothetical protein